MLKMTQCKGKTKCYVMLNQCACIEWYLKKKGGGGKRFELHCSSDQQFLHESYFLYKISLKDST